MMTLVPRSTIGSLAFAAMLLGVVAGCGQSGSAPAASGGAAPAAGSAAPAAGGAVVTDIALTMDRNAPQAPGTTITWTAVPVGGVKPYQYKWWVHDGKAWTLGAEWSSGNTFAWTPKVPHPKYVVAVWVRSAGNTADAAEKLHQLEYAISAP